MTGRPREAVSRPVPVVVRAGGFVPSGAGTRDLVGREAR